MPGRLGRSGLCGWLCNGGLRDNLGFGHAAFLRVNLCTSTVASSVAPIAASGWFWSPGVFALGAGVLVGLQDANAACAGTIVNAIGASTPIARITRVALLLLPGEDDSRNADHFGFHFETRDVFIDLLGFKVAAVITCRAAAGATCLVQAVSAPAGFGSGGFRKLAGSGKDDEYGQQHLSVGGFQRHGIVPVGSLTKVSCSVGKKA